MGNGIISAVKRLERAGSENSRATQKLFEAAREVACFIEKQVPIRVQLPRGYYVRQISSNVGVEKFLSTEYGRLIDGIDGYLHGDLHRWIPGPDRATVLEFAKDIATGLLDEIADWLEARAAEAEQATEVLKAK